MKHLLLPNLLLILCTISFDVNSQNLYLGPDTSYCTNEPIPITSNLIDSTYSYLWSSGDTTTSISIDTSGAYWLQITFDTLIITMNDTIIDTVNLVDTINLTINSVPISDFSTVPRCFSNPSLIINNSIFETGSIFTYISGTDTLITPADTVAYPFLPNGDSAIVFVMINQLNGCSTADTFSISSLLTPTILLLVDSTCENIAPVINNQSNSTTLSYTVSITESTTYLFSEMPTYQLPLQSSGLHSFNCILTNNNGCSDTMMLPLYIFNILPREIIGLKTEYCHGDPTDQINGNFSGGSFTGPYITNLTSGQALFDPNSVDSNILIIYTYTDSNNCTSSTNSIVQHIYPLPQLSLEGLEDQYCQYDPSSIISVTPMGGNLIGPGLIEISENGAVFTPNILGPNHISYSYTDNNMCSNSIIQTTIVNPLPDVELGPSDTLIGIGDTLVLGPEFIEPNVNYSWSTGQDGNNLEVINPGYYVLFGTNNLTTCHSSDTIRVELINKSIEASFQMELNIYPLPFTSELFIESPISSEFFKVYDVFGRSVKFDITRMDDITRLGFENPSHPYLVLQLTKDFSVPIVRTSSY